MMRTYIGWVVLLLFGSCAPIAAQQTMEGDVLLADPHIFFNDGRYYLYGTGASQGFRVYVSEDMQLWEGPAGVGSGLALKKGDAFGNSGFWAPQVFKWGGALYMAYTADEHIAIARGENPLGPFTQTRMAAISAPVKQIDPFVFIDDDGKKYLYHVRVANGGNRIFVAGISDDFSTINQKSLTQCISATEEWENRANDKWSVAEGPTVLKHKGFYYLIYSANHFRSPDYAVGYAVSRSPFGPWKKYEGNPILSKENIGINGTGHGDVVVDGNGEMFYVFHTHQSDSVVGPRRTALMKIRFAEDKEAGMDKLEIDVRSFRFLHSK